MNPSGTTCTNPISPTLNAKDRDEIMREVGGGQGTGGAGQGGDRDGATGGARRKGGRSSVGGEGFPAMGSDGSVGTAAERKTAEGQARGADDGGDGRLKSRHQQIGGKVRHSGERVCPLTPPARLKGRGDPPPGEKRVESRADKDQATERA